MPENLLLQLNDKDISTEDKRKEHGEIISKYPERFKACEECNSVSLDSVYICPVCSSYAFVDEIDLILGLATKLGGQEKTILTDEDLTK